MKGGYYVVESGIYSRTGYGFTWLFVIIQCNRCCCRMHLFSLFAQVSVLHGVNTWADFYAKT